MRNVIRMLVIPLLIGGLLMLASAPVGAHFPPPPNDFLTGGGFIIRGSDPVNGPKANFGVGGGVKNGDWWGHLQYIDHGTGLNVHWTSITGYFRTPTTTDGTDPQTKQPTGSREICGTARTNQFGDVVFRVRAVDKGEPGVDDIFRIKLGTVTSCGPSCTSVLIVYSTDGDADHTLGGTGPGGGNIQLHKGNNSNTPPNTPPDCHGISDFPPD